MKNKKGTSKLSIRFVAMTLVVTGICMICMAEASFIVSSRKVKSVATENYELLTEEKSVMVSDWYLRQRDALENQVFSLQLNGIDKQKLQTYLKEYVNGYIDKYVYDIYFTDFNNKMISGTGFDNEKDAPDVDFTKRFWFQNAVANEGVVVSTAYKDVDSGHIIITLSKRVIIDGKVAGVLALDVFIESLDELFNDEMMEENSYGFIVDSNMGVIIHPNEKFEYTDDPLPIDSVGIEHYDKLKAAIERAEKDGEDQMVSFVDYDGVDRSFYIKELEETGWYIITAVDNDIITGETKQLRLEIILVAVVVIFASFLIESFVRYRNISRVIDTGLESERHKAQSVISAVTGDYELLMNFNYKTNAYEIFHADEHYKAFFNDADYNVSIRKYAEANVLPSDMGIFIDSIRRDKVLASLVAGKTHIVRYRTGDPENPSWHECRFAHSAEYDDDTAVVGIRNIDSEVSSEQAIQAELQDAKEKAEAASNAKSMFLFNMSHDIRTPMNAIMGFTDMAIKHMSDNEKVRECLEKVKVSGEHLLKLINDVLDMSRIESGKIQIEENKVDISDASGAIITMCKDLAEAKNIDLKLECDVKDKYVYADEIHVNQIIMNVVSNAIKYTNEGGRVVYGIRQVDSDVPGFGSYIFTIEDNGIGMSKDFLKNIFEAFTREQNSTHSKVQGTGLGMAIVKKLVDLLDGKIEIESEPGKGTIVTIKLNFRLQDAKPVKVADVRDEQIIDLTGKKILLVEDNEMNREIAKDILEDEGIIVDTAEDGDIAVEMIRNNPDKVYDAILMDIQMPRMNGYEATKLIRELPPEDIHVPIIALSANAFEEDKQKSREAGMDDHLAKPINIEILLKTLSRFCK